MSFRNTAMSWNCYKVNKKVLDCLDNMMIFWKILSSQITQALNRDDKIWTALAVAQIPYSADRRSSNQPLYYLRNLPLKNTCHPN